MPINAVPDRSDVLTYEEARTDQQRFLAPWLEFFRSVFYALFGWRRSFTAKKTHDFGNIAAGGQATTTLGLIGVRSGDHVSVSSATQVNGLGVDGYVSASDTVTIRRFNYSTGAIDPASDTFRVIVLQQ